MSGLLDNLKSTQDHIFQHSLESVLSWQNFDQFKQQESFIKHQIGKKIYYWMLQQCNSNEIVQTLQIILKSKNASSFHDTVNSIFGHLANSNIKRENMLLLFKIYYGSEVQHQGLENKLNELVSQTYGYNLEAIEANFLLENMENMNKELVILFLEKLKEHEELLFSNQSLEKLNQLNVWSDQEISNKYLEAFYQKFKNQDNMELRLSLICACILANKQDYVDKLLQSLKFQSYKFKSTQSMIIKTILKNRAENLILIQEKQENESQNPWINNFKQKIDKMKANYIQMNDFFVIFDEDQLIIATTKEEFQKNGKPKGSLQLLLNHYQEEHKQKNIKTLVIDHDANTEKEEFKSKKMQ